MVPYLFELIIYKDKLIDIFLKSDTVWRQSHMVVSQTIYFLVFENMFLSKLQYNSYVIQKTIDISPN